MSATRRLLNIGVLVAALIASSHGCDGGDGANTSAAVHTSSAPRMRTAPALISPAEGATLDTPRPTFEWRLEPRDAEVLVQICTDPACANVVQKFTSCSGIGAPAGDIADGTYFWRAARVHWRWFASAWSEVRSFVVVTAAPEIGGTLNGVWSAGVRDVWAVGNAGKIAHFDGRWRLEESPTCADLRDVWATYDGSAVWAVGASGITIRRTAGVWTVVPSATTNELWGVWGTAADDVWAVGDGGIIQHWDGTCWTVSHDRGAGILEAVSGPSATDVWAVGGGAEPDGDRASLLLHWDGSAWTESYVCNPEGNRFAAGGWVATLHDVWALAASTTFAAGDCFPGGGFVPAGAIFERMIGGDWGEAPGITSGLLDFRPLASVFASGPNDAWVASYGERDFDGHVPTMLHFDGATWTASPQEITTGIHDLGGTGPDDVWAVGNEGKRLHWDGTTWTAAP